MEIFKIVAIGIMGAILSITLKNYRPEISVIIGIATGVIIVFSIAQRLDGIISQFENIILSYGIYPEYLKLIIKLTGISYITKFASDACKDCGENAIAGKVELAGKISAIAFSLPVIENFLNLVNETLNGF